jgi:hypothetical protein
MIRLQTVVSTGRVMKLLDADIQAGSQLTFTGLP